MSQSAIVTVIDGQTSETLLSLRNGHGSAPVIWNALCLRYTGQTMIALDFRNQLDRLWSLHKDVSVPRHQRAVLIMTFDRVYIPAEHYAQAAADIRAWLVDFPADEKFVNHWPEIAAFLESVPAAAAVGLWATDVDSNPFAGDWDDNAEGYLPVTISDLTPAYHPDYAVLP